MRESLIYRGLVIVGALIIAVVSLYPPLDRKGPDGKNVPGKIRLGLDLRGGTYLVLQVVSKEAVAFQTSEDKERLERELKDKAIGFASLEMPDEKTLVLKGVDPNRITDLEALVESRFKTRKYVPGADLVQLVMTDDDEADARSTAVEQALETIRNRVDQFGVAEPSIQRLGNRDDRISVQFPGVDDPERIKNILRRTAVLELKIVEAGPTKTREALLESSGGQQPPDTVIVESAAVKGDKDVPSPTVTDEEEGFYLLRRGSVVSGMDLKGATRGQDQFGQSSVNFSLKAEGSQKFGIATKENIGRQLAIVLDGRVKSAPVIRAQITDRGEITGNFSPKEAEDLALVLRSGSLPASIRFLEERTIGPGLGQDAIKDGVAATLTGFVCVLLFMVIWYRGAGINAIVALLLNVVLMLAIMSWFRATLTLPGIAGYVLTIGMAVDANVLIFERIREELRIGKTAKTSIQSGFEKAFGTIFDANLTTLIGALFLFKFGTGPVKGFAVSLTAGICASMFTAVFVSRFIFDLATYVKGRDTVSI